MSEDLRRIIVDGKEIEVPGDFALIQACEAAGAEIPRFCYHERLSVAGNCRMCLVQVVGAPKPVASCAQQVRDLRPGPNGELPVINTGTPMVQKARDGVMEFLLINHPLDCPICDQGGECDLQDQAVAYGRSFSRYDENKRAVENKYMGPLIKTIMTRCIQCTRCVRFVAEVAGEESIGMVNRGEDSEITTYLERAVTSELSGNVIDLCPVGALTSKPYAYEARPWELEHTESVDVMDAMGASIRIDSRGAEVMRILPRVNEEINEEWISDKTRFVWDGLLRQRLDRPYVRKNGRLTPVTWPEALDVVAQKLSGAPDRIGVLAGDLCDAESMKALLDLLIHLGVQNRDCRQDGASFGRGHRASYLFNSTFMAVEEAQRLILIGANPRLEAPVLNARIRKAWLNNDLQVSLIGEAAELTYGYDRIGEGPDDLDRALSGDLLNAFRDTERAMVIVGAGAYAHASGGAVLNRIGRFAAEANLARDGWNGFNVLHTAAARVAGLDMGFLPGEGGKDTNGILAAAQSGEIETLFLLGADEIDMARTGDAFVIYLGSHGDAGANRADVVLPGAAYTEKPGTYVNSEGRVQLATRAVFPKGDAREDWAIIRALSGAMGRALPYDDLAALRVRLVHDHDVFGRLEYAPGPRGAAGLDFGSIGAAGELSGAPFVSPIRDFYFTNPVARASKVMAECSAVKAATPRAQAAE
jgi:NADH-quinone oxidoreductase subunit G